MEYYAFLNENNIVTSVIAGVDGTEIIDGLIPEQWYENFTGQKCKRTSINNDIRFNYAGIGYSYSPDIDAFIPPKCHDEAVLDEVIAQWICNNPDHTKEITSE